MQYKKEQKKLKDELVCPISTVRVFTSGNQLSITSSIKLTISELNALRFNVERVINPEIENVIWHHKIVSDIDKGNFSELTILLPIEYNEVKSLFQISLILKTVHYNIFRCTKHIERIHNAIIDLKGTLNAQSKSNHKTKNK